MGTTADKTTYLNTTKLKIKDGINRLGGELTNLSTFRSYETALDNLYNEMPKVTGEGSNLSLTPTRKGGLTIIPKGACEQDSYSGKNKLPNINPTTQTKRDVTATLLNDGTLQLNGTNTGTSSGQPSDFYFVGDDNNYESLNVSAGNYYFSGTTTGSSGTYLLVLIRRRNGANTTFLVTTEEKVVDIQDGDTFRIMARVTYQTSVTNLIMKPMLSATANDTFEKYVGGIPAPNPDYPQDIRVVTGDNSVVVQNKNLLPFNNQDFTLKGVRFYVQNGNLIINGTATGEINTILFKEYFSFTLLPGTYTMSRNINIDTPCYIKKLSDNTILLTNNGTFTLTEKTDVFFSFYIARNFSINNINDKFMLESGTTASEYIPHKEQTYTLHLGTNYLAGIGDYKDEIVGKIDDWKIKRNVGKKLVDGTNIWNINNNCLQTSASFIDNIADNNSALCDVYKFNSIHTNITSNLNNNEFGFNTQNQLTIKDTRFTSGNDFNTWLQENNINIYYIATHIEETITDTILINDLNNMYQAMGYDGTTNITITSNPSNAQMTASVSALKELI